MATMGDAIRVATQELPSLVERAVTKRRIITGCYGGDRGFVLVIAPGDALDRLDAMLQDEHGEILSEDNGPLNPEEN